MNVDVLDSTALLISLVRAWFRLVLGVLSVAFVVVVVLVLVVAVVVLVVGGAACD